MLLLAAGALALMLRVDRLGPLVGLIGLVAVLFLVLALLGRYSGVLPWVLALAGAQYATFLVLRESSIDGYAPIFAAGLLLVAELAYWSIERRVPGAPGEGLAFRRGSLLVAACVAAGGIGGPSSRWPSCRFVAGSGWKRWAWLLPSGRSPCSRA